MQSTKSFFKSIMHSTKTKAPRHDRDDPPPPYRSNEGIDSLVKDVLYPPPRHEISESVMLVLAELFHARHSLIDDRDKLAAIWRIFCNPNTPNKPLPTWARSTGIDSPGNTDTETETTSEDIWLQIVLEMPYPIQLELAVIFPLGRRILAVNADETLPLPAGCPVSRAGVMLASAAQSEDSRPAPAWIPSWRQMNKFPTPGWESWFKLCLQAKDLPQPAMNIIGRSLNSNMQLELPSAVVFPRCKPCRVTTSSFSDPVAGGKYKVYILDRATGYESSSKSCVLIRVPREVTQEMILSSATGWRKVYLPEPYNGPISEQRYTLVTWVDLKEDLEKQLYYSGSDPKILVPWVVCKLVDPRTGEEAKWEGETWMEPNSGDEDEDEEEEGDLVNRQGEEAGKETESKNQGKRQSQVHDTHQDPEIAAEGDPTGDGWVYLRKVAVLVEEVDRSRSAHFWSHTYKDEMLRGVKCRFV